MAKMSCFRTARLRRSLASLVGMTVPGKLEQIGNSSRQIRQIPSVDEFIEGNPGNSHLFSPYGDEFIARDEKKYFPYFPRTGMSLLFSLFSPYGDEFIARDEKNGPGPASRHQPRPNRHVGSLKLRLEAGHTPHRGCHPRQTTTNPRHTPQDQTTVFS